MKTTHLFTLALALVFTSLTALGAEQVQIPVTFSGAMEVELTSGKDFAGDKSSGVALATVELGIDASINEWTSANVLILHEDDAPDTWEVDEGGITIGKSGEYPYFVSVGRMYVPFGAYETRLVSDPLTLEIGEAREAAIQVGYEAGDLSGSFFAFNGDTMKAGGDDSIEHFGINVAYTLERGEMNLDMGASYLNNIGDSDGITGALATTGLDSFVGGIAAYAVYSRGPYTAVAEYVSATGDFEAAELAFDGNGAKPSAYNLEFGYDFNWGSKEATVAAGYQGTQEAVDLGLPESRLLVALSVGILEGTSLNVEWANDEDYGASDGGTGKSVNNFTVQLGVEF